jgi:hypothetical protein
MDPSVSTSVVSSSSFRILFWNGDTEFRRQTAHGVRQHRLLLDQQGSGRMQGQDALLLNVLGWYELHVGPRGGFADRGGIGRVVLLSLLHEGFDRLGRDQLHVVSESGEHARPMMGRRHKPPSPPCSFLASRRTRSTRSGAICA